MSFVNQEEVYINEFISYPVLLLTDESQTLFRMGFIFFRFVLFNMLSTKAKLKYKKLSLFFNIIK